MQLTTSTGASSGATLKSTPVDNQIVLAGEHVVGFSPDAACLWAKDAPVDVVNCIIAVLSSVVARCACNRDDCVSVTPAVPGGSHGAGFATKSRWALDIAAIDDRSIG